MRAMSPVVPEKIAPNRSGRPLPSEMERFMGCAFRRGDPTEVPLLRAGDPAGKGRDARVDWAGSSFPGSGGILRAAHPLRRLPARREHRSDRHPHRVGRSSS
ncbi:protein of unknown function [Microbacterium sp. Nx66]|nr:protein of unknown function [Microbacterium sp. Nx66]